MPLPVHVEDGDHHIDPGQQQCAEPVNSIAARNWTSFSTTT
jgi:hypothetical protein